MIDRLTAAETSYTFYEHDEGIRPAVDQGLHNPQVGTLL